MSNLHFIVRERKSLSIGISFLMGWSHHQVNEVKTLCSNVSVDACYRWNFR